MGSVTQTPRVLMICDAGPEIGIGHLMRCVALAEEFQARGFEVLFSTETAGIPWAAAQVAARSIAVLEPPAYDDVPGLLDLVDSQRPQVVVIDSYLRPLAAYAGLRGPGCFLLAIVDGDPAGREADLYLDQNIGAEHDTWPLADGSTRLAGLDYALMRADVLGRRPDEPRSDERTPPRVLTFFGGTDAAGAAPVLAEALIQTGAPFEATVVAATPELADAVNGLEPKPEQSVQQIGPSSRLAELVAEADLVVSASGTSSWELCCLGAAAGLVCVAENQVESYRRAVDLGVAAGLGPLAGIRDDPAPTVATLRTLLTATEQRAALRRRAWQLVDGQGRRRVVDAVVSRL